MKNYSEYTIKQNKDNFEIFDENNLLAIVDERDGYILLPQINPERYILFQNPTGESLADVDLESVEHDGIVISVNADGEQRQHFFDYFDESKHQLDCNLKDISGDLTIEGELEMMLREMKRNHKKRG